MKAIIICADDFGLNPSINEGIIKLIELKRISATSCLVTSDHFSNGFELLKPWQNKIDIGCHINLTEGNSLSKGFSKNFPSLKSFLLKNMFNQFSKETIEKELKSQIECFCDHVHAEPDFIDGHQHIINVPIVYNALLKLYSKFFKKRPYIRTTNHKTIPIFKSLNISSKPIITYIIGGGFLTAKLNKIKIPTNNSFAGFYNFKNLQKYPMFFEQFLKKSANKGIIMCHPANTITQDQIGGARYNEFKYLKSHKFINICNKLHIKIARYNSID